jgi:hypothetical protein
MSYYTPQVYFDFCDLNQDGIDECVIVGISQSDGENIINSCGGTWGGIYATKGKKFNFCFFGRVGSEYAGYNFKK